MQTTYQLQPFLNYKKNARFLKTGIDLKACIYFVNHSLAFTKASNQGETSSFLPVG